MALARGILMRLVLLALVFGAALATPATACPRELRCIVLTVGQPLSVYQIETPAPRRPVHLALRMSSTDEAELIAPLRSELVRFEPTVADPTAIDVPWIWVELRARVYNRLPRYDQTDENQQFSMVLAPVVVTSPSESTPGLGVSGAF
jgi:hypothetical protein